MGWTKFDAEKVKNKLTVAGGRAVENAVRLTGEKVDEDVPHDTGALMQSKFIKVDPGNILKTFIGYGGGGITGQNELPYAIRVHEVPLDFQKGRTHNFLRMNVKTTMADNVRNELSKIRL